MLYDDWNAYVNVNDDRLEPFIYGKASQIYENVFAMDIIGDKRVKSFGIYDGLLTVKLDMKGKENKKCIK